MPLKVIGAGLGRTATFSLKFGLEHLGFGPCYHMTEVFAGARRNIPLWLDVIAGKPDWDSVFDGYQSTTDYPAASYWRELADYYPDAKVVLTVRDANNWFDSVTETIFSDQMHDSLKGTPLCEFLEVPVPDTAFPRVNSRDEIQGAAEKEGGIPPSPEEAERFAREYIEELKAKAFGGAD